MKWIRSDNSPSDAFYSKLLSENSLEAEYRVDVIFLKIGKTTDQTVVKLKLSKPLPSEIYNFQYLQEIWKKEQLSSFKLFLHQYGIEDIVLTSEAIQKIAFYHDDDMDVL